MTPARWCVATLWLATFVAVDPAGFVATGPLRTAVVSVAAMLLVASALALRSPSDRPSGAAWPNLAWGVLLALLAAATVTGVDPLYRWIGTPDRRLGLLSWVVFGLLFLAGQRLGAAADRRAASLAASAGVGLAGVWALAEVVGRPPLGLTFADGRAGGPFGQPAYLGAALALGLPLAVGAVFDGGRWRWGWWPVAAVVLGIIGLVASQTRAAVIGLAVAGAVTVARRPWPVARRRAVAVAGALALVAMIGAGAASSDRIRTSLGDGGLGSRLDEWEVAAAVIAQHPVLGLGPEGYRIGFAGQVGDQYVQDHGLEAQPDRAHNAVLDVAAIGGLAAGATYLVLLVAVGWRCWRAVADPRPLLAGLAAGVIAYSVQQMLLFPLSELDPVFWLSAGMVVGATSPGTGTGTGASPSITSRLIGLLALVAVLPLFWFGALDVVADRALAAAAAGGDEAPLERADRATELRGDSIRNWFVASRVAGRGETILDVDAALDRIEQGMLRSPRDPILRREHSTLLTERALRGGLLGDLDTAREATTTYLADAPADPVLARNQALLADAEAAGDPS